MIPGVEVAPRPAVSVVVPFAGGARAATELLEALGALELADGDEVVVVDNSTGGAAAAASAGGAPAVAVVRARERRSSYYARNVGARAAASDWLLFLDADCRPSPTILGDYFGAPIGDDVGAVAGAIEPSRTGDGLIARHARSRRYLDQATFLSEPRGPFVATANLLVRRAAWARLGGFCEVWSGGDVDFSWRLQEAGYRIDLRPAAVVEHRHRDTLWALVRQRARYGAGERWLASRRPERRRWTAFPPVVAYSLAAGLVSGLRLRQLEPALFGVLDAVASTSQAIGWFFGNEARPWRQAGPDPPAAPRPDDQPTSTGR